MCSSHTCNLVAPWLRRGKAFSFHRPPASPSLTSSSLPSLCAGSHGCGRQVRGCRAQCVAMLGLAPVPLSCVVCSHWSPSHPSQGAKAPIRLLLPGPFALPSPSPRVAPWPRPPRIHTQWRNHAARIPDGRQGVHGGAAADASAWAGPAAEACHVEQSGGLPAAQSGAGRGSSTTAQMLKLTGSPGP